MPKIKFLPSNEEYQAEAGESVLDVALTNGVSIQHACGGFCACTTCHIYLQEGELSDKEDDEQDRLTDTAEAVKPNSRLACQAKIKGDVIVQVVNEEY